MSQPLFDTLAKAFSQLPEHSGPPANKARYLFYPGTASAFNILMDGTEDQRKSVMSDIARYFQSELAHFGDQLIDVFSHCHGRRLRQLVVLEKAGVNAAMLGNCCSRGQVAKRIHAKREGAFQRRFLFVCLRDTTEINCSATKAIAMTTPIC